MTPAQVMEIPPAWLHLMHETSVEEEALAALTALDSTAAAVAAVLTEKGGKGFKERRRVFEERAGLNV